MNVNVSIFPKILVTLALCITAVTVADNYYADQAEQRHHATMILLMQGGIPAVTARCILESKHVIDVYPCSKAASPKPGREL